MKKILIIMRSFPGRGGDQIVKFVKYLYLFNYEAVIVTDKGIINKSKGKESFEEKILNVDLGGRCSIHQTPCLQKTPFRIFSKFFHAKNLTTYFENLFFIPDLGINWIPSALLKSLSILKREQIDVILTNSPPESTHIIGLLLKKFTSVTWIVDFQDLWTTKKIVYKPPTKLHDFFIRKVEKIIYRNADQIIANTNGNREIYLNHFDIPNDKITVITNGYDPFEVCKESDQLIEDEDNSVFNIGYMGYFDKPGFPWKEFLLALKKLLFLNKRNKININMCGYISEKAKRLIDKMGLKDCFCFQGILIHSEAVKRTRKNDLLLVLMYETDYSRAIIPHKVYHYLGMHKPIMCIAEEEGELASIIKTTRTGRIVSTKKINGIFDTLHEIFEEWKRFGSITYTPNVKEIEKYDIKKLTKKLSETIDTCNNIN